MPMFFSYMLNKGFKEIEFTLFKMCMQREKISKNKTIN